MASSAQRVISSGSARTARRLTPVAGLAMAGVTGLVAWGVLAELLHLVGAF